MIKVFTLNKNGKIELTEKELKELLDEAYWEGYKSNILTWPSPNVVRSSPTVVGKEIEITCGEQNVTKVEYETV